MSGAPRLPTRPWQRWARGVFLALAVWAPSLASSEIVSASYREPTSRYPHGVLGDPSEYAALEVGFASGARQVLRWDRPIVFEDTAPRLVDVDGDGAPELLVVESHERLGARFAIYRDVGGRIEPMVANPFIGTRFRWLAIVGAADLDGDGLVEVAYVDRPHLAKTLRVWRVTTEGHAARVEEVASLPGVTNHRIGEVDIAGGVRACGLGPEMIVADAGWSRLLSVRFDGVALAARDIGPHRGRPSFAAAMAC